MTYFDSNANSPSTYVFTLPVLKSYTMASRIHVSWLTAHLSCVWRATPGASCNLMCVFMTPPSSTCQDWTQQQLHVKVRLNKETYKYIALSRGPNTNSGSMTRLTNTLSRKNFQQIINFSILLPKAKAYLLTFVRSLQSFQRELLYWNW